MNRSRLTGTALLLALTLIAAACAGGSQTETILIPDTKAEASPSGETAPFAVKTIYPVMDGNRDSITPLGWTDNDAILAMRPVKGSAFSLERLDVPYESRLKLMDIEGYPSFAAMSPDGKYVASLKITDKVYDISLVRLDNGQKTELGSISDMQMRFFQPRWSGNSRFFAYVTSDINSGESRVTVYDAAGGNKEVYTAVSDRKKSSITSVYISDDGQSAALVRSEGSESWLEYGDWNGSGFAVKYKHPVLSVKSKIAEWMNPDQLAFIGDEGNLYAYDRRNGNLTVLLEKIENFSLSKDRKFIAYYQDGGIVNAAALYGNNVLNKETVYRGIAISSMEWSPDNGKLLLSGYKYYDKYYDKDVSRPAPVKPMEITEPFVVIEFKS